MDYHQEDNRSAIYKLNNGQLRGYGLSDYKKYKRRLDGVEDVTFLNFLLYFNYSTYKRRPRARPQVILYFPRYNGDCFYPQYPKFCYIKLILYHPWREYKEVAIYTNRFRAPNYMASY